MQETQIKSILNLPVTPIQVPLFRPLIPVVALSRLVMCPIKDYEILTVQGVPSRFALIQYTPHGDDDPILPVPLVDFGETFFKVLRVFTQHIGDWQERARRIDQKNWARKSMIDLQRVGTWLSTRTYLEHDEKSWLMECLYALWAQPDGAHFLSLISPQEKITSTQEQEIQPPKVRDRGRNIKRRKTTAELWQRSIESSYPVY